MKQLTAFIKKEFLSQLRDGKIIILSSLFCLFGILNPATAKMLPWLFEMMSKQLAGNGVVLTAAKVDARTSWTQFFKNMPVLTIIFIVMSSSILTLEYQEGTLIHVITKGLKRWKILISKLIVMYVIWTAGYLMAFTITYSYNAIFWDNRIAQNLSFAVFGYYLVGLWLISIILLVSSFLNSAYAVTLSVGAGIIISYLLGFLPALQPYVPTFMLDANGLLTGAVGSSQCSASVGITVFLILLNVLLSVLLFNKRQM